MLIEKEKPIAEDNCDGAILRNPLLNDWLHKNTSYSAHYQWLSQYLHEKRLLHSVGAFVRTQEFCSRFGLSDTETKQALTAALLHDAAKLLPKDNLLEKAQELGLSLTSDDIASPPVWHALVGAAMVEAELGITDPVILNAIRRHTTADSEMTNIDMIVYLADKIEPYTRSPEIISAVLTQMQGDELHALYTAFRYSIDDSLAYLGKANKTIHPKTRAAQVFITTLLNNQKESMPLE